MLTITKEFRQAIRESHGKPVHLIDPETRAEYVILSSEIYEQLHGLLYNDTPLTTNEQKKLLVQTGLRAGWDDLEMDIYNDLDPQRAI